MRLLPRVDLAAGGQVAGVSEALPTLGAWMHWLVYSQA